MRRRNERVRPDRSPRQPRFVSYVGLLGVLGLLSCEVPLVEMQDVVDPNAYRFVEHDFTPMKLERNMKEIDEQYAETRTPAKVKLSLETAELSISAENDYAALWRAARACAWLGQNAATVSDRDRHAALGVAIGRKAAELSPTTAESWYYAALCMGAYCEVKNERGFIPPTRLLEDARYYAKMAAALDETIDHAGPHRFLGKLICETAGTPKELADFEVGLDHLKRAVELSPDFAQNRLFLAEAYIEDDESELARAELDRVFALGAPPDHTVEYQNWLREATRLLGKTSGAGSGDVDVSGFDDARAVPASANDDDAAAATTSTPDTPER